MIGGYRVTSRRCPVVSEIKSAPSGSREARKPYCRSQATSAGDQRRQGRILEHRALMVAASLVENVEIG
jgi:hypothetical protein